MAKQLWLLRHGEAVPHSARPDADRELTPKGENQSRLAGKALVRLGVEFAACYTSPKIRARDTARITCEELGIEVQEAASLEGGFDRSDADELMHAHEGGDRVLVVGHEPDFSSVVWEFTGARIDLKKGGLAAVKLGSAPELVALLRPDELEAMAG